jgi:hypothetical protein
MAFSLDPEAAAVLQAALEKNGPTPTPPAGDVHVGETVGTDQLHVEYGDAGVPVGRDPIPNKPLGPDERHARDEFGRSQRGGLLLRMA